MRAKNTAHRYAHTALSTHSVREGMRKWRKSMILLRAQMCVLDVQTERTYTPCVLDTEVCNAVRAERRKKPKEWFRERKRIQRGSV
jgi:hypothetical protein